MSSILTNTGAMVALQTMRGINTDLDRTQNEISTGLKVSSAKDNAASWSISKVMSSDVAGFSAISDTLKTSSALVSVGRSAAEQITETLIDIEQRVIMARDSGNDLDTLQAEVDEQLATIASIAESAQFNGVNLVGADNDNIQVVVSMVRDGAGAVSTSTLDIDGVDLQALGDPLALTDDNDTALEELQNRLDTATTAAATFGAAQQRIDAQADFISKQTDAMETGIGALVDADMEAASARLQALQVQQQLATQSLSIANQQPQNILSLFR